MIIGLTGKKRSGKDTVAEYLVKNHGFIRIGFADALKNACKEIFNLSDNQLYGTEEEKERPDEYWKHSAREILQKVGTELFRNELPKHLSNISNDIWIRVVDKKIKDLLAAGHNKIVISDVRFENEAEYIKNSGGIIIKLNRPSLSADSHSSEKNIDNIIADNTINNTSTLEELYTKVENIIG